MSPYRDISPVKHRWPGWLNATNGRSGVYVIRRRRGHATLYVGESHTGNLRRTLQRHFWHWKGKTAGVTYDTGEIEVAIELLPPSKAVSRQNELIQSLAPEDNTLSPLDTAEAAQEDDGNPF
ncbi:MAG: hypothetical protein LBM92_02990 [Opitutaceae bacterium]|jgi:hypothetical protein|nr:hypothetical protein [Opitutaceae bacterium]